MALVTLTTCTNSFEAEVIKGRLASENIPCLIQGENINLIYGGMAGMDCRVLVNEEELEKAQKVMKEE